MYGILVWNMDDEDRNSEDEGAASGVHKRRAISVKEELNQTFYEGRPACRIENDDQEMEQEHYGSGDTQCTRFDSSLQGGDAQNKTFGDRQLNKGLFEGRTAHRVNKDAQKRKETGRTRKNEEERRKNEKERGRTRKN